MKNRKFIPAISVVLLLVFATIYLSFKEHHISKVPNDDLEIGLKELFQSHAINNTVVIVQANSGFLKFLKIFLCTASQLQKPLIPHLILQSLGPSVTLELEFLKATYNYTYGIIPYHESFHGDDDLVYGYNFFDWKAFKFNAMMRARGQFILKVLATGFDVVFCDADMILLKNPLDILFESSADLQVSTDSRDLFFKLTDPFEGFNVPVVCFGFFYARNNHRTRILFEKVADAMSNVHDQTALNSILNGSPVQIIGKIPFGLYDSTKIKGKVLNRPDLLFFIPQPWDPKHDF